MPNNLGKNPRERTRKAAYLAAVVVVLLGFAIFKDRQPSEVRNQPRSGASSSAQAPGSSTSGGVHLTRNKKASSPAAATNPTNSKIRSRSERFPDAVVLQQREVPANKANEFIRTEIIETTMKYPFLRVESRVHKDPVTGQEHVLRIEESVADHVVVQLKDGKTEVDLKHEIAAIAGTVRSKVNLEYASTYLVALPEVTLDGVPDAIRALTTSEVLDFVEADGVSHNLALPNDSRFVEQWSLLNTGQTGGESQSDIRVTDTWSIQTGSDSVIIAVSDTGIDYNHRDLKDNIWSNAGESANGKDDDGNGLIDDVRGWNFINANNDPFDDVDHGTRVAGIIGARGNNATGISGISWRCKIIPVRVMDDLGGFNSDIAAGFDYARRMGAKILNASHGGYAPSEVMQIAVDNLQAAGVLVVAAAGNEEINNDLQPLFPASFPNVNVISVAYTDHSDAISPFSNFGLRTVDLAAPGVKVLSTSPGNVYRLSSGSSFAAPHVAGVAALLKAQNPGWGYGQIRAAILQNVDAVSSMYGRCVTGGRLNAFKALRGAISTAQGVDNTTYSWRTGGAANWHGESTYTYDGNDAAQSPSIADMQDSWLETTVLGPGTISFLWKVSSEPGTSSSRYDYLQFLINGTERAFIEGEVDWQEKTYILPAGTFRLRWRYSKDQYESHGQDRGWVDAFTFVGVAPAVTVQPVGQTVPAGSAVTLTASASGTPPFTYQWKKNDVNIPGATASSYQINNAQPASAGDYKVVINNAFGSTTSGTAHLTVCSYTLQPTSTNIPPSGSNGQLSVSVSSGCSWAVSNAPSWITIDSGASGDGDGTILYTVAPNDSDLPRRGSFTVGNKTFSVTQYGNLPPVAAAGNTFSMTITQGSGNFAQDGSFLLSLLGGTNEFRKIALSGASSNSAGVYLYSRSNSSAAALSLSNDAGVVTGTLTFDSPNSGAFTFSDESGSQEGTFNMVPTQTDLNEDGLSDLLWQSINGPMAVWYLNGTNFVGSASLRNGQSAGAGWRAATMADINGDGSPDLLFQHDKGQLAVWYMRGTTFRGAALLRSGTAAAAGWKLAGANDFDNDSKQDLLFQHDSGRLAVWRMDGTNFLGSTLLRNGQAAGLGWRVVGMSDFNNDGQKDIVWQHSSGLMAVWNMIGTQFQNTLLLRNGQAIGAGWRGVGFSDCNHDGFNDLLFQHDSGMVAVWFMQGGTFLKAGLLRNGQAAAPGWYVVSPANVAR